jgi:hypothetical protein
MIPVTPVISSADRARSILADFCGDPVEAFSVCLLMRTRKAPSLVLAEAQQMRWSRRGVDLLLQVRCAVYNGALGPGFGNLFKPISNTVQQLPLAA